MRLSISQYLLINKSCIVYMYSYVFEPFIPLIPLISIIDISDHVTP